MPPELPAEADLQRAVAALRQSPQRLIVGVRHHSPACADAVVRLLAQFQPDAVLVELPQDYRDFIGYLADPLAQMPLALAAASADQGVLGFLPFGDFSPELAAIRWARAAGVPAEPCDAPLALERPDLAPLGDDGLPWAEALRRQGLADDDELWETLVESRHDPADPAATQRAALAYGWLLRAAAAPADPAHAHDLQREAWMRERLQSWAGRRMAVVVGSFHAAGLLDDAALDPLPRVAMPPLPPAPAPVLSLVPYHSELFDARSGYPAGIEDPEWRQRMWQALAVGRDRREELQAVAVEVCRHLRSAGHPAGPADAVEIVRLCDGMAQLRGLPVAGRAEFLQAAESALGHGQLLGRGRALAQALQAALVGGRRGILPPAVAKNALREHVAAELTACKLAMPQAISADPLTLRLDPLRSPLDLRRVLALRRLQACGVPYAERVDAGQTAGVEALTEVWTAHWVPATDAALAMAAIYGPTLPAAAAGALRSAARRAELNGEMLPPLRLQLLENAAQCGLAGLAKRWLGGVLASFPSEASTAELVAALQLCDRLRAGHVPALADFGLPVPEDRQSLRLAALASLEGLSGSDQDADAAAAAELAALELGGAEPPLRLQDWAARTAAAGSALMQGAALGVQLLAGDVAEADWAVRAGSWLAAANSSEALHALRARFRGLLLVAADALQARPDVLVALGERLAALADGEFLAMLPALRGGAEVLSPADRQRLLQAAIGDGTAADGELDPLDLGRWLQADLAGALAAGLGQEPQGQFSQKPQREQNHPPHELAPVRGNLGLADRWRLVLGEARGLRGPAAQAATLLSQLYGYGHGEGSGTAGLGGQTGGDGQPELSARQWLEQIEAVFGNESKQFLAPHAALAGRISPADLAPSEVTPSVELLEGMLSLQGALAEAQLAQLRPLVRLVAEQLAAQLAVRIAPALAGLTVGRPSRRPAGRLDWRRTLRANLASVRRNPDGTALLVAKRLHFLARGRRQLDWHVWIAVDVSGSMAQSVIYSALCAAILAAVPALQVHLLAFSTQVIDLTQRASDPLALLLEARVGGGTDIAKALRYVRQQVAVPQRTLLALVSDFADGRPAEMMCGHVAALCEAGVKCLGIAALTDAGQPCCHQANAARLVAAGMPVAAVTPLELARWIAEQVRA